MSQLLELPILIPYGRMVGKFTWYRLEDVSGAWQGMKWEVLLERCRMLLANQCTGITRETSAQLLYLLPGTQGEWSFYYT